MADSDLALWVVDGQRRGRDHQAAAQAVENRGERRLFIALNKADLLDGREAEAILSDLAVAYKAAGGLCVSARNGRGVKELIGKLADLLPEGPALYPEDTLTDQSLRDMAAEMVRESAFMLTRQEIPYSVAVTVDEYREPSEEGRATYVAATIHVEKESQKRVVIGREGRMLKEIGRGARLSLEAFLGGPVFLKLFVRATIDWSKNPRDIKEFGYGD
jgi:GTP-binding protein Era